MPDPTLQDLLVERASLLDALVRRHGGALLRKESVDDLAQGIRVRLLEKQSAFEWRGEAAFGGWLEAVVRNELNGRRAYWNAARRAAGHVLRLTVGPQSTGHVGVQPAASLTGPLSFAERRDQIDLALEAMETLLPRDQSILELERGGASVAEVAEALDLTAAAAAKARQRALDRFRRAFEHVSRGS